MSFGFSVGDFVTAGLLINSLITSLSSSFLSSSASYRELARELHVLKNGLDKIQHLEGTKFQQPAIEGIKVAALNCQWVLNDFAGKLRKYEGSLGESSTSAVGKGKLAGAGKKVKDATRKVEWEVKMKQEVQTIRAYLVAHVGSLNMRLMTLGLEMAFHEANLAESFRADVERKFDETGQAIDNVQETIDRRFDEADEAASGLHRTVELRFDEADKTISSVHSQLGMQHAVVHENNSILNSILSLVKGEVASQLNSLMELAQRVCKSNIEIVSYAVSLQKTIPSLDLQYTWAQKPVKLEDALGRIIPVPSEYDWNTLEAVILARFSSGPGHKKVHSGEYELFNTFDGQEIISRSDFESLTPGMNITMAIIVGRYGKVERCPQPNCRSKDFRTALGGGSVCLKCTTWFDKARKELPRPQRPPNMDGIAMLAGGDSAITGSLYTQDVWRKHSTEQRKFKNLRIHISKLPETPREPINILRPKRSNFARNSARALGARHAYTTADWEEYPDLRPSTNGMPVKPQEQRRRYVLPGAFPEDGNDEDYFPFKATPLPESHKPKWTEYVPRHGNLDSSMELASAPGMDSMFPRHFPQSSYHPSSLLPSLDMRFMSDFTCCGMTIPDVHGLLQHYDIVHKSQYNARQAQQAQQTPQPVHRETSFAADAARLVQQQTRQQKQNNPTVSSVDTPTLSAQPLQQQDQTFSPGSSIPGTPTEADDNYDMPLDMNLGNDLGLDLRIDEPAKQLYSPKSGNSNYRALQQQFALFGLGNGGQFGNSEDLLPQFRQQQMMLIQGLGNGTAAMTMNGEEYKPFPCPVIGCERAYKNQNGLKYHKTHGHLTQQLHDNGDGSFSIINPETSAPYPGTLGMEKEKPYKCDVCGKRYKNVNGLKYHKNHSPPCDPELKLNSHLQAAGLRGGPSVNAAGLPGIGEQGMT